MTARAIRLPLEIGVSALTDLTRAALLLPLGLVVMAVGIALTLAFLDADGGDAVTYTVVLAMLGLFTAAYSVRLLIRAWRTRPADVVFGERALRIEGGPAHGFTLAFVDIDPGRCRVTQIFDKSKSWAKSGEDLLGGDPLFRLTVHDASLADADVADEIASMREVLAAIQACATTPDAPPGATPAAVVGVLACGGCGGVVAPSELAVIACAHCNEPVAIPEEVRERVRAAATLAASEPRIARNVDRLLDQPGARPTSLVLAVSLLLIGGAWPLATWGFVHLYRLHELTWLRGVALGVLPLLLIADGFFLSRARLVNRHALGTLVMSFGARPPATAGAPLTCRACAAPLPARDATVVSCVFCDAANLTGVDLRALAGRTESSQISLEAALAARAKRLAHWRWRTLASLPAFALTIWILHSVLVHR